MDGFSFYIFSSFSPIFVTDVKNSIIRLLLLPDLLIAGIFLFSQLFDPKIFRLLAGFFMTICIIGLGLIGGSVSLRLRQEWKGLHIVGFDCSENHAQKALHLELVHEILPLAEAVTRATLIIIAIPVDECIRILPRVLDLAAGKTVMDTGSTKGPVCLTVMNHPNRECFVATHPMWGTEYAGPDAARADSFSGKAAVICERERSGKDCLVLVEKLYKALGMHLVNMSPKEHDIHTAYISHISHITSFALANTVLQKEKEDKNIFELASGGFESTVRLAKSKGEMWVPILLQNREHILDVLQEHIDQLNLFKGCLEEENPEKLKALISRANSISRVIK